MKNYALCIQCVFIFTLSRFLVVTQDASPAPSLAVPPSENISSDSELEEQKKLSEVNELQPSVDIVDSFDETVEEKVEFQPVFAEATNAGVANEITQGGPPVVVTLTDAATAELEQRAILPSQDENSQTNQTSQPPEDFKEINQSRSEPTQQTENVDILSVKENLTEEIPSFSEWAQKQLEEAEKNKDPTNASTQHQVNGKQTKIRWKNYASLDCGAKVVAANPEAVSPSAILSPSRDEYKLNTCNSRIWFIVELCEAIQAKKIDLANFELFSSVPKEIVVSVSDRFPTREWANVGHFTAKDERDVQSFDLDPHLFGKYIKVEVKSHYGSEHYCPISLFRVYGTSEFEVLQKEDPVHADRLEDDADDDDDDDPNGENDEATKNLFSSATDAVISMVKKAAEVLGKGNHSNQTDTSNNTKKTIPLIRVCTSPSHLIVCDNCSDALFGQVYELLSCEDSKIRNLINIPIISRVITDSNICQPFGFDFSKANHSTNIQSNYIKALFPERFLGAMCNMVAVFQNKVVLNISNPYTNDTKTPEDEDALVNIETSEPHVIPAEVPTEQPEITDALSINVSEAVTKSTCSTDVSYSSQIKPTKTLTSDLDVREESTTESNFSSVESVVEPVLNLSQKIEVEEEQHEKLGEVESVTESAEGLEDPLDPFIEFNGEGQHASTQSTATPQAQNQKSESVFLRLSNRIKALERNMSLSGQYLEELSKRYKKQVEEIQKLLDKTILSMSEESKKKDERNKHLEERLLVLTASVEALIAERRSWSTTIYCVIVSSLVTLFVVTFCCKIPEPLAPRRPELKRRKSLDLVQPPPQKKKRRPSDQALKIVRSSTETGDSFRKKKKKKQLLKRSNSIGTLNEDKTAMWGRQESAPADVPVDWVEGKHLEEVPFVLEESEHSTLEPVTYPETGRFFKTAMSSRAVRVNGVARKSASVDETGRGLILVNGVAGDGHKEKKKGLKRIFRKVF